MATNRDLAAVLEVPMGVILEESQIKEILASAPFLPIPQALNLRSISAPSVQPNLVFRSGALHHLPPSSLNQLNEKYNITTVVDLRNRKERAEYPSPEIEGVETVWIPSSADVPVGIGPAQANPKQVLQGINFANFAKNDGVDGYVKMYANVLDTHKEAYKFVFEKLKENQGPLLFHCTAGKDRTGILAALILGLVDAPPDVISRDYALTRVGVEPQRDHLLGVMLQNMAQHGVDKPFELPGFEEICGVRGQTILAVLKWMDGKWGVQDQESESNILYPGVHGYLTQELGFSSEDLERIKKNLAVSEG
ncbi:hypothetical protein N431DRAFT_363540 [Stipitochalara longipes BDJ]|nr:hypothetical protein N431DRAFT_363540 [Stipitochalara longipes BDJ]